MNMENKVVKAIFQDCSRLIENFTNNNSTEFKTFCNEYKKIKFYHIYTIQLADTDMILTTRWIFNYCKNIFNKSKATTAMQKIGVIYLMYCTYYKQPQKMYVKVEVDINSYKAMIEFIDSNAQKINFNQARYIFYHMLSDNAFRFVLSEIYYGLEPFFNKPNDFTYVDDSLENNKEEAFLTAEITSLKDEKTGFLKAFEILETEYNSKKNIINKNESNGTETIPVSNIFREYKQNFDEIANILNIVSTNKDEHQAFNSNIINKSGDIKKKAFTKKIKKYKSMSVFTEDSSDLSESDEPNFEKEIKPFRKKSKAIDQLLTEPLPKPLLQILEVNE